jgi:hypothetical protein
MTTHLMLWRRTMPLVTTLLMLTTACGSVSSPAAATPVKTIQQYGKLLPPTSGAYLGASVNPASNSSTLEAQAELLESHIGRTLALHMHYYGWGAASDPTAGPQQSADLIADIAKGRVPVVSWGCSYLDSAVAAGTYDSDIDAEANLLKAIQGRVLLRWFWEMNGTIGTSGPCLGTSALLSTQQSNFTLAWQHIWQRFQSDGVTNVTWLWNVAGAGNSATGFYPGPAYVDWIGDDEYGYFTTANPAGGFTGAISSFYNTFSAYGKPMILGETGGCPTVQDTYINTAASKLPTNYPGFNAFMYWDSVGTYTGCPTASTPPWIFTSAGLPAFTAMGAMTYFSAMP